VFYEARPTKELQMLSPKPRQALYADIEALPPHVKGELIYGVLHTQSQPSFAHQRSVRGLVKVTDPFDPMPARPGGWKFVTEPELHLGPDVIIPDVAGWHLERVTFDRTEHKIKIAPDWIAEVLSPSTALTDRIIKLGLYAAAKIGHCWYVDPIAKTLEVFELDNAAYVCTAIFDGEATVSAAPFAKHPFSLAELWS
jgi:Uma2 family endonuclease